jgi:CBS-domain-containing membrane protein
VESEIARVGATATGTALATVMNRNVVCTRANVLVSDLVRVFGDEGIGCAPVVDGRCRCRAR